MSEILAAILKSVPDGWQGQHLYVGANWTISIVQNAAGEQRAGLAATPGPEQVAKQARFQPGFNQVTGQDAIELAQYAQSAEPVVAAVGLATLNALLQPDSKLLEDIDAADWLVEHGRNRQVAVVGRFPFIEELQPVVANLWVFELNPQPHEYGAEQAALIIPQADIVAITSSTLVNHTLDALLALVRPPTKVMLLGPTTPLSPLLFDFGVDLLSGTQVVNIETVLASIQQGVTFRKMAGLHRVTLQKRVSANSVV